MSIQDGEEHSDDEEGGSDAGAENINYVALLEGTRSQRGQSSIKICADALQQLEDEVLNTGEKARLYVLSTVAL